MHVTPLPSPRMAKSTSLGVLEQDTDMHIVDQDDIIGLTQDVKSFSDGLARLKGLFTEPCDTDEDLKVLAHERLGDVLCTLKSVLQRHPPLNTTELFSAAGTLISNIKNFDYEDHSCVGLEGAFSDAIDQLALEFSSSVSEYLMGDLQHNLAEDVKTKSYDHLMCCSQDTTDKDDTEEERDEPAPTLTAIEIDDTLGKLQAGLELAFQRAKAWSKYMKDIMSYIDRRALLEVDYSKNLARLATSVKPALTEEGFLPLQSVYCTVLSQDVEYAKTCQASFTLMQSTKFIEPLTLRRMEHDKIRKNLKENWNKEVKKMQESVSNLRKAQALYITRQQEFEKAKDLSQKTETDALQHSGSMSNFTAKMDKKRKAEDEALHKAAEAETTYKACVAEADSRQADLQKTKTDLLAAIREQILLSDQIIKKVTIEYFQLLQTVSAPVPVQYNTLCEASKRYEAGSQYQEYVRRLPISSSTVAHYEQFKFEPYKSISEEAPRKTSVQSNESATSDHHSGENSPSPRRTDKYRVPVTAWSGGRGIMSNSDTDSQSGSSKSLDSSPSNSPFPAGSKKMVLTGSMDDLIEDERDVSSGVKSLLAVPGTESMDVHNLVKRAGRRRNTTFGVSFQEQVEHYHSAIPPIMSKSLKEVEKRGITVKGIYRVSGVKSTVENLCQKFENDPESVNLTTENPNVISNVLKLYLRQLPDPLLTFKLYPNFIQVAKEHMSGGLEMERTVEKLHELIDKLPFSNRKTCGVLMHHLKRVASHVEQNQMNASNLGIVFGPTLLRPQGGNASLACLVDTPHQTKVVELLIVNAENMFGPSEDHLLIPGETLVESMDHNNVLQVPQPATVELPKEDQVAKPEPVKEPSPTISLSSKEEVMQLHTSTTDTQQQSHNQKGSNEEVILPGSAGYDKKDGRSSSQGADGDVETGSHSSDGESDIQSDDDLLLPDGSHHSQHALPPDNQSVIRSRPVSTTLTPPLTTRRDTKSIPSTASSPNLSLRYGVVSPPVIKIDDSVPEFPQVDSSTSESDPIQQKVLQLPPVNTWVPKGESIFTSILDARSPQVYRRTNASTSKTASFPQSTQGSSSQRSRVSWPQWSPSLQPQLSPPMPRHAMEKPTEYKDTISVSDKSPKLLRKCTSFDLERSKPFPARSMISSPMMLKKGTSVDESVGPLSPQYQAPKMSKWTTSTTLETNGNKIVHNEEDEMVKENLPDVLHECVAGVPSTRQDLSADVTEFDAAKIEQSLEDPCIQETDILDDIVRECDRMEVNRELNRGTVDKSDNSTILPEAEALFYTSSPDLGAKPKTKAGSATDKPNKKLKSKPKSKTERAKSDSGLSSKKPDKDRGSKEKSKSSSSTVKTALLSSAAKLKVISRKSPVRLLSYKTNSFAIPDQTGKPARPLSTSQLDGEGQKLPGIHQTESSPTVLIGSEFPSKQQMSKSDKIQEGKDNKQSTSVKTENDQPDVVQSQASSASERADKNIRPCEQIAEKSAVSSPGQIEAKNKVPKVKSAPKSSSDKPTKTVSKTSQPGTKQATSASTSSKASTGSRSLSESSVSQGSKKVASSSKAVKKEKVQARDTRPKPRMTTKRDSISSLNSDTSKKSDHFHDCCHVRRKPDKK